MLSDTFLPSLFHHELHKYILKFIYVRVPPKNNDYSGELQSLFFGRNTMARRLNKLKKDILDAAARGETKYEGITVSDNKIDNLFFKLNVWGYRP